MAAMAMVHQVQNAKNMGGRHRIRKEIGRRKT
jgi:hypothetical protein